MLVLHGPGATGDVWQGWQPLLALASGAFPVPVQAVIGLGIKVAWTDAHTRPAPPAGAAGLELGRGPGTRGEVFP